MTRGGAGSAFSISETGAIESVFSAGAAGVVGTAVGETGAGDSSSRQLLIMTVRTKKIKNEILNLLFMVTSCGWGFGTRFLKKLLERTLGSFACPLRQAVATIGKYSVMYLIRC